MDRKRAMTAELECEEENYVPRMQRLSVSKMKKLSGGDQRTDAHEWNVNHGSASSWEIR